MSVSPSCPLALLFPPGLRGSGGHCPPSNYKPGFSCPLVAQRGNDLTSVLFFPTKGKDLQALAGASKDRLSPKKKTIVVASQTHGPGFRVSNLGLL